MLKEKEVVMKKMTIRIERIAIKNYKGIDQLELDFPPPRMRDDPDILVMGSKNGLGKTAIMECCSLLLLAATFEEDIFLLKNHYFLNVPDLLIRAGSECAEISGDVVFGEISGTVKIQIDRLGTVNMFNGSLRKNMLKNEFFISEQSFDNFINAICGFTPNPVVVNTFLLFHSYRKVQEGNPELGMMVGRDRFQGAGEGAFYKFPMSEFKLRILRSMMGKAQLFELEEDQELDNTVEKLNELVKFYAGGTVSKLRPSLNNTVDFLIQPVSGGASFTFDGLSSGQKEIISTLFLIWEHTKNSPSVVFIDEPELHLNDQWHRSFVRHLASLAPWNQYIMATHSEDIMDSVDKDRRILLVEG